MISEWPTLTGEHSLLPCVSCQPFLAIELVQFLFELGSINEHTTNLKHTAIRLIFIRPRSII